MSARSRQRVAALIGTLVCCAQASMSRAELFVETEHLDAPINAVQLIYCPEHESLVLKNSASAVALVRIEDGSSQNHLSTTAFMDMSLSEDGDYVYASDYGGENIGYGTPRMQSYVHRLDVESGEWEVKKAYIAGRIEATTGDRFLLQTLDQWVDISLNAWGAGEEIDELVSVGWAVYYGDLQYDRMTGRVIHGNSGLSSQEITAFKINGTMLVPQEKSGTYGTASGHGGTYTLATDGSLYYYGRLSVDALDVSSNRIVFSESIYAAMGDVAFGNGRYYDPRTGAELGQLGFATTVYGLNPDGCDFWTYDASTNTVRHFERTEPGAECDAEVEPADAGMPDTGIPDSGPLDAGSTEPPRPFDDAGGPTGWAGAGASADAATDAGSQPPDAAAMDSGSFTTAPSQSTDAGHRDAGRPARDASIAVRDAAVPPRDSGRADSGHDAGTEVDGLPSSICGCNVPGRSRGPHAGACLTLLALAFWVRRRRATASR